jgi:hypothetical protein
MKYTLTPVAAAVFSIAFLVCASRAEANHGIRIDGGNGTGCMSTWTTVGNNTAAATAFVPGGTYSNTVECTASGPPSVLFGNLTPANDAATVNSAYTANSGEMFQYVSNGESAQAVIWNLTTGPYGPSEVEIELNQWCPGGSASSPTASFKYHGNTFNGGCDGAPTDLLFSSSGALVGYVSDSTFPSTITQGTSVPGWIQSGGAVSAPEMHSSTAIAALTLLLGGLVVLRGRRTPLARAQ